MFACYIDESGDTGEIPHPASPIQPLLCILGLSIDLDRIRDFTLGFIDLKRRFFPGFFASPQRLEWILREIKGADLRSAFKSISADHRRRHLHIGFFDALLAMIEANECKIFGRVWVKPIATRLDGQAIYTSSVQAICSTFNHLLEGAGAHGLIIPDPTSHVQNRRVSFSVFTQKFRSAGDAYPRLIEMPTYGQSENHAGIQVCDLLCSGLLFPIAAYSYCTGYVTNIHVDAGYEVLKKRYAVRLKALQYRSQEVPLGRWQGGLVVSDPLGRRDGGHLFR
jgi:hypothetical protein